MLYNLSMIKKVILLSFLLLFVSNVVFAVRAVTKAEHEAYLRGLGLNDIQIVKLQEIDRIYLNKRLDAQNESREYRRNNPNLTKEEYERYHSDMRNKIEKDYKKDLGKVLNYWQKKNYLEYKSRVY